ncbi:hypothetical protein EPUS_08276 [Endocarpon pusillum Z07020]|uniref:Uncharacterized protein n=1 Tax=Endocarpon pusillum (strain Z07020 / HMAS-L-300199) TaxID=1263415 RepID=U1HVE7_ENDPU|nr:uncharacterized protein EPUS_08276 [Endocarpon pusillum Z07020]ERF73334.1 hypothetical protein EPUS_08276 [Endocarpon pusillum Z07020]
MHTSELEFTKLCSFLCTNSRRQIALHLRHLLQETSEKDVSRLLFTAIRLGKVQSSVSHVLLSVTKSPITLIEAIIQTHSVHLRQVGIKYLGKALRKKQWRDLWHAVGGTEGFLSLFATLSTQEVGLLSRLLKKSRNGHTEKEKAILMTELLSSLFSSNFPDAPFKNPDERLLQNRYAVIAPASSQSFVSALLSDEAHPLRQYLSTTDISLQCDHDLLQSLTLTAIFEKKSTSFNISLVLRRLCQHAPPGQSSLPGLSATMLFSLNLLREIGNGREANISTQSLLTDVVEPLLRRIQKRRRALVHLEEVLHLAIRVLQLRSAPGGPLHSLGHHKGDFSITSYNVFELDANQVLKLYQGTHEEVQPSQRWPLLHLLFLHNPKLHADIDTIEGLQRLKDVRWMFNLFLDLPKDQALPLLRNLIAVMPDTNFLAAYRARGFTIFAHPPTIQASGGDPDLLLTFLEREESGALQRVEKAITEKKRKSATSREHADRAFFAKSALHYAIASGSLAIYGETVAWARRFIRDPLTCKTLYTRSTTNTVEGIALLAGIPSDVSQCCDAIDIGRRVISANTIVSNFSQTWFEASKEPHFQSRDWQGPVELLEEVISARRDKAADLRRALKLSDDEVLDTLWLEMLKMLFEMKGKESELEGLLMHIQLPPHYLARLATEALDKLSSLSANDERTASMERKTYNLLRLLGSSDCPQLASDLVLRAVLDRPEASSWHRMLLSKSLIMRLSATNAQALLRSFATSIKLKLDAQAQRRASQSSTTKDSKPIIKVTTVKYLAQILGDSELVAPTFAVDVLSALLGSEAHLDVRIAVVESLLAMLTRCTSESSKPLASRLLSALEETIPIAGSLHERRLLSDADWIEADRTGNPPEIYDDGGIDTMPPLLNLLVQWNPSSRWRPQIVQRILLPIVKVSTATNNRWVRIFLARHAFVLDEYPPTPVKPILLAMLLSKDPGLMPASILEHWHQVVLINLNPSEEITNITRRVKADVVLHKSNEGRHWLSLFGMGTSAYQLGRFNLSRQLLSWAKSEVEDGINLLQIQHILLDQAKALLFLSDDTFEYWNRFMEDFEPRNGSYIANEDMVAWARNTRPVIENVISFVQSLRTPSWQQNPDRQPSVLPPIFHLRLWLLPYPNMTYTLTSTTGPASAQACRMFAEELASCGYSRFAAVGNNDTSAWHYAETFQHLSNAASRGCSSDLATLLVAYYLGYLNPDLKIGSTSSVMESLRLESGDLLRLDLAEKLLLDIDTRALVKESREVQQVLELVSKWKRSTNEEIRMKGIRIAKRF